MQLVVAVVALVFLTVQTEATSTYNISQHVLVTWAEHPELGLNETEFEELYLSFLHTEHLVAMEGVNYTMCNASHDLFHFHDIDE